MQYRFFAIPLLDNADEMAELNRFLAQHRVLEIEKQCVTQGQQSFWSFAVSYEDKPSTAIPLSGKKADAIDYKEKFNDTDLKRYSQLRSLRKQIAQQEGIPAYSVFTNAQLAEMIEQKMTQSSQLSAIEGVGSARLEKYATLFLEQLTAFFGEANHEAP